jgi:hypothetical protein
MVVLIIVWIGLTLPMVVYSFLDTPISVSCRTNFDATNWTHHAFLIQTFFMILAGGVAVYYLYKRCRPKLRSKHRTRAASSSNTGIHDISPPYGQVPMLPAHQSIPLYAYISPQAPTAPPTNTSLSNSASSKHVIVS